MAVSDNKCGSSPRPIRMVAEHMHITHPRIKTWHCTRLHVYAPSFPHTFAAGTMRCSRQGKRFGFFFIADRQNPFVICPGGSKQIVITCFCTTVARNRYHSTPGLAICFIVTVFFMVIYAAGLYMDQTTSRLFSHGLYTRQSQLLSAADQ
jgi:hypothetical protein